MSKILLILISLLLGIFSKAYPGVADTGLEAFRADSPLWQAESGIDLQESQEAGTEAEVLVLSRTVSSYRLLSSYTVQVFGLTKYEGEAIPYSLELEFEDGALLALPCMDNLAYLQEGDVILLQEMEVETENGPVNVWVADGCCVEEPDWIFP